MRGSNAAWPWAVALLAVAGALYGYGLVAYEPKSFHVLWATNGVNEVDEVTLSPGGQGRITFPGGVPAQNLSRVAFSLAWTDDVPPADTFSFNVTGPIGPDGAEATTPRYTSDESPLIHELAFLPIPATTVARGANPDEARAGLGVRYAPWEGNADFTIGFRLDEARGGDVGGTGIGGQPDPGNKVRISMSYTQYHAILTSSG